jgi:acyl-homoserine-lactone acylase
MRADGALDAVCEATGETEACAALAAWDGRSDRTSRGVHLFEAFVANLPSALPVVGVDPVWTTPFDPADPFGTPRGLNVDNPQVVQAMQAAIDQVREAGVPFDARWGDLQVAGDRGAPPIELGGGAADSVGNANALASYRPEENDERYKPITYGSSHIQAIAFRRNGPPIARTILTYSQSEDPTSRFSSDQTRLFGAEKWVRFAWTDSQIRRDRIAVTRLR